MKDSEFIELLNLYLDHEISPADAARLEAEVLGNPARREIYRDYCRMQKACKVLAQEFAQDAAPVPAGNVVAFEAPRRAARRPWYAAGGFAAAAACVAFVFIASHGGNDPAPATQQGLVQTETAAADRIVAAPSPTERTIGRTVSVPESRDAEPMLVNALTLVAQPATNSSSLLSTSDQDASQFEWMRTLELAPVQRVSIEEFRFDGRSPLRRHQAKYGEPRLPQGQMEWNAIRYQK